ncbi:MAG: Ig-like domain-containing protein [Oligoflexales bacterium]
MKFKCWTLLYLFLALSACGKTNFSDSSKTRKELNQETPKASGSAEGIGKVVTNPTAPKGAISTLKSIEIKPSKESILVGETVELIVTGIYQEGKEEVRQDLTERVNFSTLDEIVTFSKSKPGEATGARPGDALIEASLGNQSTKVTITVTTVPLKSIAITPNPATIALGHAREFQIQGTFADGSTKNLSASSTWSISDPKLLEISSRNKEGIIVKSLATGNTVLNAKINELQAQAEITISAAVIERISLEPNPLHIAKGLNASMKAMGYYSDGQIVDITNSVQWRTSSPSIVKLLDEQGSFMAVDIGETVISAENDGVKGSASVLVSEAILVSLSIKDLSETVYLGESYQLRAIGQFSDDSSLDLTNKVSWSLDNEILATISPGPTDSGRLTLISAGRLTVFATLSGIKADQNTNVVDLTPSAQFSVANVSSGSVEVPLNSSQAVVWRTTNAINCELKKGMQVINTELAESINVTFQASTTMSLECENLLGSKTTNSVDILVVGAPTVNLSVAGNNTSPIAVAKGLEQTISWSSNNATNCEIKHAGVTIANTTSGSTKEIFNSSADVSIECTNNVGIEASKVLMVTAVPAPMLQQFSVAGNSTGPVDLAKDSTQKVLWNAVNASSCMLKQGNVVISNNSTSGSQDRTFSADTNIMIECENSVGIQVTRTIAVNTVASPSILQFTVAGASTGPVEVDNKSVHPVVWNTANTASCSIKHGSTEISTQLSGTHNLSFAVSTTVSIECRNSVNVSVSKSIDVVANLVGDIGDLVNGFYDNPNWNELVIEIDANNNFMATYDYRKGTLTGTYNPQTGVVTAWWCEVRDGVRAGTIEDYGDAEFIFVGDDNDKIDLIGKWRKGTSGKWYEDWDLTLIPNPNSSQQTVQQMLESWFNIPSYFCYQP